MTGHKNTDGLTAVELDALVWAKAWEIAHSRRRWTLRRDDLLRAERFYEHTISRGRP